jgi:hypothetical protein
MQHMNGCTERNCRAKHVQGSLVGSCSMQFQDLGRHSLLLCRFHICPVFHGVACSVPYRPTDALCHASIVWAVTIFVLYHSFGHSTGAVNMQYAQDVKNDVYDVVSSRL